METPHRNRTVWLAVLTGCVVLAVLLGILAQAGVFEKRADERALLPDYGTYSPVLRDGTVYFPTVTGTKAAYETARRAQLKEGAPVLITPAGTATLPDDYLKRLYTAFGMIEYGEDMFENTARCYPLVVQGEGAAVCGVIFRHNEQFYIGNLDCELTDALLSDVLSALLSLGVK